MITILTETQASLKGPAYKETTFIDNPPRGFMWSAAILAAPTISRAQNERVLKLFLRPI